MRATLSSLVLLSAVLVQADPGWAREWRVERVSGTAWTIESIEKRNVLAPGMMVPEGLTIATAPSGRVRLSSENNVMTLGPGSVAVVRPKGLLGSRTEVLQRVGSIEFDVEKRSAPHFTVQTPYMAAVVKGTAFTISVSRTGTTIGVDRGLVQVQDLRTGETAGVGAGQGASVSSTEAGLRTAGADAPDVTPGKPSAPSVAPAGQALGTFRELQAAEASTIAGRSAGTDAAASTNGGPHTASRSAGDTSFGFYGGDDGGRDGSSLGMAAADTRAGSSDTPDGAVGPGPQGSDGPQGDAGPGSRGSGADGPAGQGNGGPGSDGNGHDGSGHGGGGDGGNADRGNGNGNGGSDTGGSGNNGNGNGGPGDGGQKGGGNGNGNNGNGNGNGGPNGSADDSGNGNGGGNGKGNNGNGNGNGGPSGNDNSGNGNNGNGNGNGNNGGKGSN